MPNLKTAKLSESEEMYLVTAVQLTEAGSTEPIPLSQLAQALSIQPASVNQMVRKLADAGYVNYLPYKGIVLLPDGRRLANRVLRRRRLWELFLVKHLELSPTEADALACRLEHITPSNVAERMFQFLDRPSVSPLGLPIPPKNADVVIDPPQPLSLLTIGQHAEIIRLEMDPAGTAFLHAEGIRPGAAITVLAIAYQGAVLLQAGERQVTITGSLADNVLVIHRKHGETVAATKFENN
ncbi:MAG: metal-dependent transcriptional regulator [Chloroflexi bacterium]|nr:MAG: metal-dependent transcriptional regulator [Chloroflexota bacterium]MBL1197372.1 metal-dependent transcriptional regulator [Chloroflexota bacterium]NOH14668.1 metal-dependent transcriptional regulator [Chloroflexota bacterium]